MSKVEYGRNSNRDKRNKNNPIGAPAQQTDIVRHNSVANSGYSSDDADILLPYTPRKRLVNINLKPEVGGSGATGATGPAGPAGATGPAGPAGADGATGVVIGFLDDALIHISSLADEDLLGLVEDDVMQVRLLVNTGAFTITLKHEDVSATAGNRFSLKNNADFALAANSSVWLVYDLVSHRWRLVGA